MANLFTKLSHYEAFSSFINMHDRFSWYQIMTALDHIPTMKILQWLNNYSDVGHLTDHGIHGWTQNRSNL